MIVLSARAACADSLIDVYRLAIEADPQLRSSELNVEIGDAQKGQALGQMLPQISANVNLSLNEVSFPQFGSDSFQGERYFVSMTQTLIDFAKFWNWRRAAEIKDQYELEYAEARHALMFNVVDRYFSVLEAEDQLYFLRTEKEATLKQLEQIKKQFAKQLIKITDVYEAEARLDQIEADEIEAESILVTVKESLKELTNAYPQDLQRLKQDIDYQKLEGPLEEWIEVAKSENPALAAQLRAIEAARNDLAAQKSRYLPVVDLQLSYTNSNTGFQQQRTPEIESKAAGINISVPIFTGGTTTHRMFEAQSRVELTLQENEAKIRALTKETSDSFLSTNASVRRIDAAEKAVDSAVKFREAMTRGFQFGVTTVRDVLVAQQAEFLAKRNLSQAKYSFVKNRIRFMRAIGMITEDNLWEIDEWLEQAQESSRGEINNQQTRLLGISVEEG